MFPLVRPLAPSRGGVEEKGNAKEEEAHLLPKLGATAEHEEEKRTPPVSHRP